MSQYTHIRTPYRLIPTKMVRGFGIHDRHADEVWLGDTWAQGPKIKGGGDFILFPSPDAACAALKEIRELLQLGRSTGPYVRLLPPGVVTNGGLARARRWHIVYEESKGRGHVGGFDKEADARAEFEILCGRFPTLDLTAMLAHA